MTQTLDQFPYTGAYGAKASSKRKNDGPTVVMLRRAMWRLGLLDAHEITNERWTADLTRALASWDPGNAGYGTGRWTKLRSQRIPKGMQHAGEYAVDDVGRALVVLENRSNHPVLELVYLHPGDVASVVCQGLHPTEGIPGGQNWAMDFCAHGGTTILAPFAGVITKLSGHPPETGTWHNGHPDSGGDIFGWSTYLTRADGVFIYMTHQGSRSVRVGQHVDVAQPIGTVGHWPSSSGGEGRSHTHGGVTSPHGPADAKRIISAIARAPRVSL